MRNFDRAERSHEARMEAPAWTRQMHEPETPDDHSDLEGLRVRYVYRMKLSGDVSGDGTVRDGTIYSDKGDAMCDLDDLACGWSLLMRTPA